MQYFHMYYKIFFDGIRERDVQGTILAQRFQINGNRSDNDHFFSYFYTYLTTYVLREFHTYINDIAQLSDF